MRSRKSAVFSLACLAVFSCVRAPLLEIERGAGNVVLDFQLLGEYASEIRRLQVVRLPEEELVWEVDTANGRPQVWSIVLSPGSNPSHPKEGPVGDEWEVVYPENEPTFKLERGVPYRVVAWGAGSRTTSAEFVL